MGHDSLWYKTAIFYEVYIRAFADSNGDGHGDIRGLIGKLDYIQDLGVDCIWLLPMYPSPLLDDGYDIGDYYGIHPDYGSLDDFRQLIAEAHRRGLRVISDLVLNHTSDQHPWFQEARRSKDSPKRGYYVWSDTDQKYRAARIIFLDTEESNWAYDETTGEYYWHRFYSHQPDLNYDNPAMQQEIFDIVRFWLDMGLDGFRADAVPYLFEREGTDCENLPETHAFLKQLRAFIDTHFPGRILLAEANQWPRDLRPYFGDGDEFHAAFHFPLMPRIYKALATGDGSAITKIMRDTPDIPDTCQWCVFLRNHDELTLEMVTPEDRELLWNGYAPDPRMRLNLGIRRRLAPLLGNDRRKIELAYAILFSLPGAPALYYGDEIGMGDNVWLPDRDGLRTPMQWSADRHAGFSPAAVDRLYSPVIGDDIFGYRKVNVERQRHDSGSLLNTIRRLIRVRKAHPDLATVPCTFLETGNPALLAYLRPSQQGTILVLNNLSDQAQTVRVDLAKAGVRGSNATDLITGQAQLLSSVELSLSLAPFAFRWLCVRR